MQGNRKKGRCKAKSKGIVQNDQDIRESLRGKVRQIGVIGIGMGFVAGDLNMHKCKVVRS